MQVDSNAVAGRLCFDITNKAGKASGAGRPAKKLAEVTVRLTRNGEEAGIYGLAIDPTWQRQGIGRAVLRQVCEQLRQEGVRRVGLEVAVDNERALGLYTSIGFRAITVEDYYTIPTKARRGSCKRAKNRRIWCRLGTSRVLNRHQFSN